MGAEVVAAIECYDGRSGIVQWVTREGGVREGGPRRGWAESSQTSAVCFRTMCWCILS